jgi:hypothetical protein
MMAMTTSNSISVNPALESSRFIGFARKLIVYQRFVASPAG